MSAVMIWLICYGDTFSNFYPRKVQQIMHEVVATGGLNKKFQTIIKVVVVANERFHLVI